MPISDPPKLDTQLNPFVPMPMRNRAAQADTQSKIVDYLQKQAEYKDYIESEEQRKSLRERDIMTTEDYGKTRESMVEAENVQHKFAIRGNQYDLAYQDAERVNGRETYKKWIKDHPDVAKKFGLGEKYSASEFKKAKHALKYTAAHAREMELANVRQSGSTGSPSSLAKLQAYQKMLQLQQQNIHPASNNPATGRPYMEPAEIQTAVSFMSGPTQFSQGKHAEDINLPQALEALRNPNYQAPGNVVAPGAVAPSAGNISQPPALNVNQPRTGTVNGRPAIIWPNGEYKYY